MVPKFSVTLEIALNEVKSLPLSLKPALRTPRRVGAVERSATVAEQTFNLYDLLLVDPTTTIVVIEALILEDQRAALGVLVPHPGVAKRHALGLAIQPLTCTLAERGLPRHAAATVAGARSV